MSKPKEIIERRRRRRTSNVVSLRDALTSAAEPFTPTIEEVKAVLHELGFNPVGLGQDRFEKVGSAVYAATGGSEEGRAVLDEWDYKVGEESRKRWDTCKASPPPDGPAALLRLVEQAKQAKEEQAAADAERIAALAKKPKLEYERERKPAAKRLKVREKVLDKLVEEARYKESVKPPPPPKIDTAKLKESAKPIIECEDVLTMFAQAIRPRLAGEVRNAKLLYLTFTSRLFEKPMNVVVKGLSALGKTHLVDRVLEAMPPEDVIAFTTLTEKALLFVPDDLSHKIFRMAEAVGAKEESLQDYLMREMLSSGNIKHMMVVKDPVTGVLVTRVVEKKGPISFVTTTTKVRVHVELETRVVTVEADDTEGQTKKVLETIAKIEGGLNEATVDFKPWHDLQRLLATGEQRVVIPYALTLARATVAKAGRMRRDFSQVLRCIQAHALIHREHRARDDKGRIVATLADYAVVRDLMADRLAEASEVLLRKNVARVVKALEELQQQHEHRDGVPTRAIVEKLNDVHRATIWRRLGIARDKGFVVNVADAEGSPGREGRWRTTGQPFDGRVLPTVGELEEPIMRRRRET
jgi:hypothetical protein